MGSSGMSYIKNIDIRWADLDPNFHMLHSKYYDLGAYIRMCFLVEHGVTQEELDKNRIGPILLREECSFRREIRFGDHVEIDLELVKARENMVRWSIRHHIKRNGELSATIQVDGSWIDLDRRRMAIPPPYFADAFRKMPLAADFHWF
jgi:acyl-CoA thioester hydrolase